MHKNAESTILGLRIGDALAMPVHWYYNVHSLIRDYGQVTDFLAPKNPHPDSILWRSRYEARNEKGEILHDQAQYWGRRGIHYHQHLSAGENTVNARIASMLWKLLLEKRKWDPEEFLDSYVSFMRTPGAHNDTYLEEWHRGFFENYARGVEPIRCAIKEKHVAGLQFIFPLAAYFMPDTETTQTYAYQQLELTHAGPKMAEAGKVILSLLQLIESTGSIRDALVELVARQASPLVRGNWKKWWSLDSGRVLGREISTVCYVEDAVPAILYLLGKYADDPERMLIANTMAGGDNVHRGAVIGAILGFTYGEDAFPRRWIDGLAE
jgi:ADP-ribosyl-[dinitrogen reductase] hydrolase